MQKFFFLLLSVAISAHAAMPEVKSVPGEYVIKFKNHNKATMTAMSNKLKEQLGVQIKTILPTMGVTVVKTDDEKATLEKLKANPIVEIAEPNFIYTANYTFGMRSNDPSLGKLWGMINTGQPDSKGQVGVPGIDVNAINAWKLQTGSPDVIVAVIDTGVNYKSKDLADNMWVNAAEQNGKKGVDDDGNGFIDDIHGYNFVKDNGDPLDDQGHGTHCSGTIGAVGNDNFGIVGVAWKTKIMALKFLDERGSGSLEDALKAIDYATKMGAKVMSNSWSGGGYSENLKEAIERSNKAGAVFIAAASNEANDNDVNEAYPASYDIPNVISVAAIDNRGVLADFSNYGKKKVHIGAPGVNIYSTTIKGYESWSGTSMATPHVAGAAVLVASQHPTMNGEQIKQAILNAARPIKGLRGKVSTGGMLDTHAALLLKTVGPDPEDPANWTKKMQYQLSSEHPYNPQLKNEWEISVPDATEISVYFAKLDVEYRFDTIKLYDSTGKLIQTLSGSEKELFTDVIKGNYVKIVFETDKSIQKYGFDVTSISYR